MLASTESLIAEMNALHEHVRAVIGRAQRTNDDRLRLLGVAEGRRNVEVLSRLGPLGEIEERLQVVEERQRTASALPEEARAAREDPYDEPPHA